MFDDITIIDDINQKDLPAIVEKKASEILLKINDISDKVAISSERAKNAKNMKTGFFGGTKKKLDATSEAVVETNEALAEMNNLIQEAINFTCSSIDFSEAMSGVLSKYVEEGFKNRDGSIVHLNDKGKECANIILAQAKDFTKKQIELRKLQDEQSNKIVNIENETNRKNNALGENIKMLQQELRNKEEFLKKIISEKTNAIMLKSDKNDERQDNEINSLHNFTKEVLNKSETNDQRHDNEINFLHNFTKDVLNKSESNDQRHDNEINSLHNFTKDVLNKSESNDQRHDNEISNLYNKISLLENSYKNKISPSFKIIIFVSFITSIINTILIILKILF